MDEITARPCGLILKELSHLRNSARGTALADSVTMVNADNCDMRNVTGEDVGEQNMIDEDVGTERRRGGFDEAKCREHEQHHIGAHCSSAQQHRQRAEATYSAPTDASAVSIINSERSVFDQPSPPSRLAEGRCEIFRSPSQDHRYDVKVKVSTQCNEMHVSGYVILYTCLMCNTHKCMYMRCLIHKHVFMRRTQVVLSCSEDSPSVLGSIVQRV